MQSGENQPTLFEAARRAEKASDAGKILMYALGDFQNRGFALTGRKLPLDRLLGAFRRAFEHFDQREMSDEKIAEILGGLGAKIEKVPSYVAKHPFRITVFEDLAEKSLELFKEENKIETNPSALE